MVPKSSNLEWMAGPPASVFFLAHQWFFLWALNLCHLTIHLAYLSSLPRKVLLSSGHCSWKGQKITKLSFSRTFWSRSAWVCGPSCQGYTPHPRPWDPDLQKSFIYEKGGTENQEVGTLNCLCKALGPVQSRRATNICSARREEWRVTQQILIW